MSSRLWLPAAAMGREGWMSALERDAVRAHTLRQKLRAQGYGGEIPRAILAPHSSSPAKNLSPDTATSFASGSALAIPYVSLPQQHLSITGLGKKGSSYPSAIDTGPGTLFSKMFSVGTG